MLWQQALFFTYSGFPYYPIIPFYPGFPYNKTAWFTFAEVPPTPCPYGVSRALTLPVITSTSKSSLGFTAVCSQRKTSAKTGNLRNRDDVVTLMITMTD